MGGDGGGVFESVFKMEEISENEVNTRIFESVKDNLSSGGNTLGFT
jgi:hypothetical protein